MTAETAHERWMPAVLVPGVTAAFPGGLTQKTAMWLINGILAQGNTPLAMLDTVELTISITDDAIDHMMRKP